MVTGNYHLCTCWLFTNIRICIGPNNSTTPNSVFAFYLFLFLTVLPMFWGHPSLLTSYKSLALILLSVLTLFMQRPQLFGTFFWTQPVYQMLSVLPAALENAPFPSSFQHPLDANSSASDSLN